MFGAYVECPVVRRLTRCPFDVVISSTSLFGRAAVVHTHVPFEDPRSLHVHGFVNEIDEALQRCRW